MAKILLVEDDMTVSMMVENMLVHRRHIVDTVDDGKRAMDLLRANNYDLLILDWGLPSRNGIEITEWYRASGGLGRILFLTGRDTIDEKEVGFSSGADDYLTKPFDLKEMMLRVEALLRRPEVIKAEVLTAGEITINRQSKKVFRREAEIYLTDMEFALLEFLVLNPNRVFTNKMLLENIWPADSSRSADTMRIAINKLRKKIDQDEGDSLIKNVHGRGYMLESS